MDAPKHTMTQTGVGPRWVLVSLLSSVPFMVPRLLWPKAVKIPFVPRGVVVGIGVVLLGLGIPLCLAAVGRLVRGFPRGELFTSGAYALCRHPIYGSWIVFIVPGLVLFVDNWVGLLAPIPMYLALRLMVRKEEVWLESTFGDAYRDYRARVRPVLPIPRFRRSPPRLTNGTCSTATIERRARREMETVGAMIAIYCRGNHGTERELCAECLALWEYAQQRVERCPLLPDKPTCVKCPVHCYKPAMRAQIRVVMRYAGPKMVWRHPILSLFHLLNGRLKARARSKPERT